MRPIGRQQMGELRPIACQRRIPMLAVALGDRRALSVMLGRDSVEQQPVMPFASSLLNLLEAAGKLFGRGKVRRQTFGHIACQL